MKDFGFFVLMVFLCHDEISCDGSERRFLLLLRVSSFFTVLTDNYLLRIVCLGTARRLMVLWVMLSILKALLLACTCKYCVE